MTGTIATPKLAPARILDADWDELTEAEREERVVEACCPERAWWWWGMEIEERRQDPHVRSFCDGYERERCRILRLPAPPTSTADLQLHLWEAKEREREQARLCLERIEASGDVAAASTERRRSEGEEALSQPA